MDENKPLQNTAINNQTNASQIKTATPSEVKPNAPSKRKIFIVCIIILLLVGGLLGFLYLKIFTKNTNNKKETSNFKLSGMAFADYKEIKSDVKPSLPSYTLKSSEIINLNDVAKAANIAFNQNQLGAFETVGFFTQATKPVAKDPNTILDESNATIRSDDMVDLYGQIGGETQPWKRKPENAVFVSSDFLMHVYHVLIDRSFQKTEEVIFQPSLKQLTEELYKTALDKYSKEQDPKVKESLKRLAAYYLIPQVLLNTTSKTKKSYFENSEEQEKYLQDDQNADSPEKIMAQLKQYESNTPPEIYDVVGKELALISKASDFAVASPLLGSLKPDAREDYTQYTPRSHYTRNSALRSYFRAMIWYGRTGFDLKSEDLTRDAAIMTWLTSNTQVNGENAMSVWEKIYLPTVFYVGRSDDLSFYDYSDLIKKVYGESVSLSSFKDNSKLESFSTQAQKLEGPKILSEVKVFDPDKTPTKDELLNSTKGFRFMGQRFVPDGYIFSSLTQGDEKPDPETGQELPSTPTALMVMSVLGSNTADKLLDEWVLANAPQSDKVIAKVKKKLKNEFETQYSGNTWTQNVYWEWLYTLKPLLDVYDDGYPMFMRGPLWSKKGLNAALGSWTELRHDTLLYAKQSYAEMGGGGDHPEPPPVPRGYVEPNLSFLTRLIALVTSTRDGFDSRKLLVPGQKEKFDSFLNSLEFFKTISEKELTNSEITDEEYEKLRTIIKMHYPNIVWAPDGDLMTEKDARVGIIADVHTDAKKGQVLYEATGAPMVIFVAVKDKGGVRLTRGVTYSYYEFTKGSDQKRMADEDWQAMIYDGKNAGQIPQPPSWTNELLKP